MDQLDREEEAIEAAYQRGAITARERDRELNELRRDYHAAAQQAAQEAYDDVMHSYGCL